jgi:hypothetical protein
MRTTDQIHIVFLQKPRYHVGTKSERDSTVVFAPSSNIFVGVGPKKVTEKTAIRDLWNSQPPVQ